MKRILITAPLRQEPKVFREYQESLDALEVPEGYETARFFVVNNCPEVIPEITSGEYVIHDTGEHYEKITNTHIWTNSNMLRMCELRNMTVRYCVENGFDYWLSADTDLVLDPRTLKYLLEADRDIVSEVFWTQCPDGGWWCNAWHYDQCDYDGRMAELTKPSLYQVGMTGALTLVKAQVFEAGVDYTRIPNIRRSLLGEDRHFCIRAACAGFSLWLDTHAPARHLYTEAEYQKYMREKEAGTC